MRTVHYLLGRDHAKISTLVIDENEPGRPLDHFARLEDRRLSVGQRQDIEILQPGGGVCLGHHDGCSCGSRRDDWELDRPLGPRDFDKFMRKVVIGTGSGLAA